MPKGKEHKHIHKILLEKENPNKDIAVKNVLKAVTSPVPAFIDYS